MMEEVGWTYEDVGAVQENDSNEYAIDVNFRAKGHGSQLSCQIDTGASCNVMSFKDLCKLMESSSPEIKQTRTKLRFHDNSTVKVKGEVELKRTINQKRHTLLFKIIDSSQKLLLLKHAEH